MQDVSIVYSLGPATDHATAPRRMKNILIKTRNIKSNCVTLRDKKTKSKFPINIGWLPNIGHHLLNVFPLPVVIKRCSLIKVHKILLIDMANRKLLVRHYVCQKFFFTVFLYFFLSRIETL